MKNAKQKPDPIGGKLVRALTQNQVADLLTAAFDLFDEKKLTELRSNVDKDIATTLSRLVATKTRDTKQPSAKPIVSDQKYIEEWENLWSAWEEIALEVEDEETKYVYQEHHWEHPYFDGETLSDDLDKIAEKMLPRLERIHELRAVNENVFLEGLQEIRNGISALPEWLGADREGFELGPNATQCVLKWEWLVANARTQQPPAFLERIIAIENASPLAHLHGGAAVAFFKSLPEEARKQIYEYVTANRENPQWKERLRTSYSMWHQLYQALS